MKVEAKQAGLAESGAAVLAVGLFEGAKLAPGTAAAAGADGARSGFEKVSLLRPDGFPPVLVVGLGKRGEIDAEKLRVAAALAAKEAKRLEVDSLAWALPDGFDASAAA